MRLKELRNQNKKKQQDLADYLNCSLMTISDYEKNKSTPNPKTLCKLADYFNVSVDYLIEREINTDTNYMRLTPTEYKLITDFYSLPQNAKEKILIYVKAMIDCNNN